MLNNSVKLKLRFNFDKNKGHRTHVVSNLKSYKFKTTSYMLEKIAEELLQCKLSIYLYESV